MDNSENILIQFGGRYLRITNTLLEDEGTHTCVAANLAGEATKDFNLHVNGRSLFGRFFEKQITGYKELVQLIDLLLKTTDFL